MFAASKTDSVSASVPEDKFNYVTMLLHGDGTNGAQNNTFVDSSTNNFSITRNGNTTQGSFSPYGSNWSNYFSGPPNYLSASSATAFDFAGDFTLEGFFNFSQVNQVGTATVLFSTDVIDRFQLATSAGVIELRFNGSLLVNASYTSANLLNVWTHIAVVRTGSTVAIFVNGTRLATGTSSASCDNAVAYIGQQSPPLTGNHSFNGYMSSLRVINGSGPYNASSSTLTVPTAPLTAITNTSLLTCQSNRFIDTSANNFAITVNGTISVQRFNPFGTATAYSTSVIGGSGYFDGSGDYLNTASITIGSGNFTLEAWQYTIPNSSNYGRVFGVGDMFSALGLSLNLNPSTMRFELVSGNTTIINPAQTYSYNSWNHLSVVRSSTTITLYINGVSQGTATNVSAFAGPIYTSAVDYLGTIYQGASYTSDVRLTNTSVYTTGFTPPTAPLTAISGTSLLLNMTNGAIFDNGMMNNLETVGNAQISTSVVKYGTGSMYFDGVGDNLLIPNNPSFNCSTGNFTLECWAYIPSNPTVGYPSMFGSVTINPYGASLRYGNAGYANKFTFHLRGSGSWVGDPFLASSSTFALSTWHHVAVTRSGNNFTLWVNGVSQATATTSSEVNFTPSTTGVLVGGSFDGADGAYNGYIDDLRFTKGVARYTTTFTPPTAAFSDTGPI
jgi:hypothetical protein